MVRFPGVFALLLILAPLASAQPKWPKQLDVDLGFRNSASLAVEQHWDVRLGLGIESEPTYQGSDKTRTELDPLVVLAYRADWGNLFLSGEGIGYSKLLTERFAIAVQLEAEDTREIEDDKRLLGLGISKRNLNSKLPAGIFWAHSRSVDSVAPATGDKGIVWFVGGTYTWQAADERLFVTVGADLSGLDQGQPANRFRHNQRAKRRERLFRLRSARRTEVLWCQPGRRIHAQRTLVLVYSH